VAGDLAVNFQSLFGGFAPSELSGAVEPETLKPGATIRIQQDGFESLSDGAFIRGVEGNSSFASDFRNGGAI